jgi:hypothetical protein
MDPVGFIEYSDALKIMEIIKNSYCRCWSYEFLCPVDILVNANVSEEHTASIFRASQKTSIEISTPVRTPNLI